MLLPADGASLVPADVNILWLHMAQRRVALMALS